MTRAQTARSVLLAHDIEQPACRDLRLTPPMLEQPVFVLRPRREPQAAALNEAPRGPNRGRGSWAEIQLECQ
jgi:hypothetical protein